MITTTTTMWSSVPRAPRDPKVSREILDLPELMEQPVLPVW
jgi:hypothetical protein